MSVQVGEDQEGGRERREWGGRQDGAIRLSHAENEWGNVLESDRIVSSAPEETAVGMTRVSQG
jgi:hypothetical protein